MGPMKRGPYIPYGKPYDPLTDSYSTAIEGEQQEIEAAADAANTLVTIKNTTLTPEEIAEFDAVVDEELKALVEPAKGGRRRKMRGGDIQEVVAKSKELLSAVLKTMATTENAAVVIAGVTVGIASPDLVRSAFSVARAALGIAAQAITPETVAFTSCAALIYQYYGDKIFPKEQPISQQIAIARMNKAIETAKATRRGSATLRTVVDKFKEDFDKSKSLTNWETLEGEALEVYKNLKTYTGPSKVGNYSIPTGRYSGITNTPPPPQKQGTPPPPPPSTASSTLSRFGPKAGRRTKRRRRPSLPTRKVRRSSYGRIRGGTR